MVLIHDKISLPCSLPPLPLFPPCLLSWKNLDHFADGWKSPIRKRQKFVDTLYDANEISINENMCNRDNIFCIYLISCRTFLLKKFQQHLRHRMRENIPLIYNFAVCTLSFIYVQHIWIKISKCEFLQMFAFIS